MLPRLWLIIQGTAFIMMRQLTNIITLQLCIVAVMVYMAAIILGITIIEGTVTAMVIADNTLYGVLS
jgi:hypothetical protein